MANVTVLAARRGESVDAMTEIVERISRMTSRFHKGQFCTVSAFSPHVGEDVPGNVPEDRWGPRSVEAQG